MAEERITDIGPPHYEQFLPPVIKDNYSKWDYHEIVKPGVMVHVAESGDKIYTVRAASPRLLAITSIRKFCDIADKYCDGFLRFTSRNNVEFLLTDESKIDPLIKVPRGRSGCEALKRRPHPGLGPLPLVGIGCFRCGQGGDGRALPVLHR